MSQPAHGTGPWAGCEERDAAEGYSVTVTTTSRVAPPDSVIVTTATPAASAFAPGLNVALPSVPPWVSSRIAGLSVEILVVVGSATLKTTVLPTFAVVACSFGVTMTGGSTSPPIADSEVVGEAVVDEVVGEAVVGVEVAELLDGLALFEVADELDDELVELEHAATSRAVLAAARAIAARRRFTIPPDVPYGPLHPAPSGNLPTGATCRKSVGRDHGPGVLHFVAARGSDREVPSG